ncbi:MULTISPECIES: hypothetical protein [unclassified Mycolicibacterium]|uniref:hypothetical protein n=1 Tax=unclassified Mycolicibacterium TaxID=2636767 RepID=UPI001F4BECF3|nr:hypothetical protein [Mycolicibacterium sp. YH-1]UNB52475.1 hypothetical protein L0M16_32320 [Mycolicibacterium sp. YH-1]
MLKKIVATGALALSAALANATVAYADDVLVVGADGVEEFYYTEADCAADGPDVHLQVNDREYPYWFCKQGEHGHWYLWNSDTPN